MSEGNKAIFYPFLANPYFNPFLYDNTFENVVSGIKREYN